MSNLENITVHDAQALIRDGALLLDVRQDSESELGHAASALHIPLAELPDHLDELEKSRRILCVCRSGGRSARAGEFLLEQGFDALNVEGGMLAWAGEDLPLVADAGDPVID